jgi:Na+/H+-dicarboxylate symporter/ABC-type amino acid transport substrate-binding protein
MTQAATADAPAAAPKPKRRLGLGAQSIVALLAGVAAGLFFGEGIALLHPVGDAYIRLVQMTVLPYLMLTLIVSLGELQVLQARQLARKGGLLLLAIIGLTLAVIGPLALALPPLQTASFFSHAQIEPHQAFGLVETYLPSNPFHAMANSVVPAVVVFSTAVGVALIGIADKERLMAPLRTLNAAVVRVTQFVVRLTPIGVFAIAAVTAGTMDPATFARLQAYLLIFAVAALLLGFVVLPLAVSALTPLRWREVLSVAHEAMLTAFVAQSVFIVIPILVERCKALMTERGLQSADGDTAIGVLLPVAFIVPNAGKLLTLLFVPYVGWLSGMPLDAAGFAQLFAAGVPAYFAKSQVALPYLLDLLALPHDWFQLYIPTAIVTGKFDSMASAMSLVATALLGAAAVGGALRFDWRRIGLSALAAMAALLLAVLGTRALLDATLDKRHHKDEQLLAMHLPRGPIRPTLLAQPPAPEPATLGSALDSIRQRDALRIAFVDDRMPFSFVNGRGDPVGLDVELAATLARDLDVARLELVPLARQVVPEALERGQVDAAMSMPYVRDLFTRLRFSAPYFDAVLGFAVRDADRREFTRLDNLRQRRALRLGLIAEEASLEQRVREALAGVAVEFVAHGSPREFFEGRRADIDAFVMTAESAAAWTLLHPDFAAVVPQPLLLGLPVGIATHRGDPDLAAFVEAWLAMQRATGATQRAYDYWVLGRGADERRRRWSVLHDVLGWGRKD